MIEALDKCKSRTPLGVCGLKLVEEGAGDSAGGRTPLGVCGLKPFYPVHHSEQGKSHPARGVWIETGRFGI